MINMLRHSDFLVSQGPHMVTGGMHKVYRYPNGYGASVVFFDYSYGAQDGLWELATIQFTGDDNDDWIFVNVPDVFGHLSDKQVDAMLDDIAAKVPAPVRPPCCHPRLARP
jgi:hypothetical protein